MNEHERNYINMQNKERYMRWFLFFFVVLGFFENSNAQIFYRPVFDNTDSPNFHVDSVKIARDTTYVYCTYYAEERSWANISAQTYLEDVVTKCRYYLIKAIGLPYSPEKREFSQNEDCDVTLLFPSISNLKSFNIIEVEDESGFNVYNVNLECMFDSLYTLHDLTQYEKESCGSSSNTENSLFYANQIHKASKCVYGIRSEFLLSTLIDIVDINVDLQNWKDAISSIDEMITIIPENEDHPKLEYNLLYKKGSCMFNSKNYIDAIKIFHRADSLYNNIDSINNNGAHANVLSMLAYSYYEIGDKDKAILYQKGSIDILKKRQLYHNYYLYQNMLATYYFESNHIKEGISYIEEDIESGIPSIIKNNEDEMQYILYLMAISRSYYALFDIEKAIMYAKEACSLLTINNNPIYKLQYFRLLSDLGMYYYRFHDDYEIAEDYLKNALLVADGMDLLKEYTELQTDDIYDYKEGLCKLYHRLSELYRLKKDPEIAILMENKSGEISKDIGENDLIATHFENMSRLMFDLKNFSEAIRNAQLSIEFEAISSSSIPIDPHIILALSYLEIGDTLSALNAANNIDITFGRNMSNNFVEGMFVKAKILLLQNKYREAEIIVSSALDEIRNDMLANIESMSDKQKERIWDRFAPLFFFYRIIVAEGDENEAVSKLYDYVLFSKSLLLDSDRHYIDDPTASFSITTWKDIQRKLSNYDIAIEFIRSKTISNLNENYYYALVIDKQCVFPTMISLFSDIELKKYSIKIEQDKKAGKDLSNEYNIVWTPILEKYNEIENIYYSPDDIFNYMNLEILFIDFDINIYRLSSTKEIVKKRSKPKYLNAVLYGGLDYNSVDSEIMIKETKEKKSNSLYREFKERGGFDPLYNTYEEVNYISTLLEERGLSTSIYSAGKGTEESFKHLSGQHINLMHMATHGVYLYPNDIQNKIIDNNWKFIEFSNSENPVREDAILTHSFLVLSGGNMLSRRDSIPIGIDDGILTALEVSQLDFRNVDLVVLSACQSALGDNDTDGLYGLQRGFKKAGADTILMSLRNVDDEATKILMMDFYRNLTIGKTKQQSLKDAQNYLRQVENGKYNKPEYWASFIMLDGLN